MTITATLVRQLDGWNGDARLYKLSAPVQPYADVGPTDHVIVSASDVPFSGPETFIFPADAEGNVINWGEMPGSFRGSLDHAEAIRQAGWADADTPPDAPPSKFGRKLDLN